jgi:UDP-N-acetylglucosamine 2-epimerase (non-hydrolysing)
VVHTGQHYDPEMSDRFFRDLALPAPDWHLGIGGGSHAENVGRTMIALEPILRREQPDWLVVYGDVDGTVAAALTGSKLGVRMAHVEAGVRSFDRTMPEEINRLVADALADRCLAPTRSACENLQREGIGADRIRLVGNVMVDTLLLMRRAATALAMPSRFSLAGNPYAVVTLHRAANVDSPDTLGELLQAIGDVSHRLPVVFPMHPRTRARMDQFGFARMLNGVRVTEPLGYLELIGLVEGAGLVLTDSGGLQVETTVLGVPCLTLRNATEWAETLDQGTNQLVPPSRSAILEAVERVAQQGPVVHRRPEGWDGHAGLRVVEALGE